MFVDEDVQCNMAGGTNSPTSRSHRNTPRPSPRKIRKEETGVQTEPTKEK